MKNFKNGSRFRGLLVWFLTLSIAAALASCDTADLTRSVSGQVTSGGSPLSGVTMTLSGGAAFTATTDAEGRYSFADVDEGTYTLTPAFTGTAFSPTYRAVYLSGLDATGFDFDGGFDNRISAKSHTVYAQTDGSLWAWGKNDDGQLGDGTTTSRAVPVRIAGISNVRSVAAGYDHTVVLTTDGKVYAWGNNSNGQLGDGSTASRLTPAQVDPGDLSDIRAIDAGYKYTMALRGDGTVWSWGYNNKGQLGNGTQAESHLPQQVAGMSGAFVVWIAAGYDHALCVQNNGVVWTWGNNDHGQLGNDTANDSSTPILVTSLPFTTRVAAGNLFSLALLRDGSIRSWGSNASGQLGDGTTSDRWTPVQVANIQSVADVAAGYDHVAARVTDGTVWTWGGNNHGQLGDSSTVNRAAPQQVAGLTTVAALATGQYGTLTLLRSGQPFWTWGWNGYGQLGDGTLTDRSVPAAIQVP